MSENNLPILKFSWNKPVKVTFKYDPTTAFKKEGEYNGAPTVSYTHKLIVGGKDMICFATGKQHKAILAANCKRGETYTITKEEIPGSKSYNFNIVHSGDEHSTPESKEEPHVDELEDFLGDTPSKQPEKKVQHKLDPMTMGMCFKIACDFHARDGYISEEVEVKKLTRFLYKMFQELMSE